MNITLPLDQMTTEDKLRAMEALWAELSRRETDIPAPGFVTWSSRWSCTA
jgi:hypothetical protein